MTLHDVSRAQAGLARPRGRSTFPWSRITHKVLHYCVDPLTEALTHRGWLRYDQLRVGDHLLALDMATGLAQWQPATAIHVFDAMPRQMIRLEGRFHSSLTTPDHRWPVEAKTKRDGGRAWRRVIRTTAKLKTNDRLLRAAACSSLPAQPKFDDALVELVAWWWTEGTQPHPRGPISIGQSHRVNPTYVERIRAALHHLFGPPSERLPNWPTGDPVWREYRDDDMTIFYLGVDAAAELTQHAPNKVTRPEFVASLTLAQLQLFIDTAIAADGWSQRPSGQMIGQTDRARLDGLQMAAQLAGYATHLYQLASEMWMLAISASPNQQRVQPDAQAVRELVDADGVVWCPTVANGTWLARRNGTTYFTGNTTGEELGHPDPLAWWRQIQAFHQGPARGWVDVGYGYGIHARDDRILEGRGIGVVAAHSPGWNARSVSLAVLGDDDPGQDVLPAARARIRAWGEEVDALLGRKVPWIAHRDTQPPGYTACPGDELADWLAAGFPTTTEEAEMALTPDTVPGKSRAVQALQTALVTEAELSGRLGGDPLPRFGPDGLLGTETERAVRAYQAGAQIPVTGVLDGVTVALLARYLPSRHPA